MKTVHPLVAVPVKTADGDYLAKYSEKGLVELNWPETKKQKAESKARKPAGDAGSPVRLNKIRVWHKLTEAALKKVLAGKSAGKLPPLDWTGTTEFQQAVWRAMLKISPGKTKSYGEIAEAIGKPKAVRAVGGACGANPIPVLVPCHRVLAANKKIGGFSGGLERKRSLLEAEGIRF